MVAKLEVNLKFTLEISHWQLLLPSCVEYSFPSLAPVVASKSLPIQAELVCANIKFYFHTDSERLMYTIPSLSLHPVREHMGANLTVYDHRHGVAILKAGAMLYVALTVCPVPM